MPPVVSIVGKSNSGKTTLIERVIPLFKEKGYKVGTLKHDVHSFDIDHEGKDTWRMAHSGADTVVISSRDKIAMIKVPEIEKPIDELVDWLFKDVDIVITEGYKTFHNPKIEVVRFDLPVTCPENNLIGIVDNTPKNESLILPETYSKIKKFNFINHNQIFEFIEQKFIKGGHGS